MIESKKKHISWIKDNYFLIPDKLNITTDILQETINALIMLLISSVKSNVSS